MRQRFGQMLFGASLALALLSLVPRNAAAFWPLTGSIVEIRPDSTSKATAERRWAKFQQDPGIVTAAARDSAAAAAAANSGPLTYISRANSNELVGGTPPGGDRTGGAPGDATPPGAPPAEVPAAADSTPVSNGPFGDLQEAMRLAREKAAADSAGTGAPEDITDSANGGNPAGAGAAGSPGTTAAAQALAARMAAMGGWQPVLTSKMLMNGDTQDTTVDLRTAFTDPSGVTLSNSLGYHNVLSLLRKQELDARSLANSLSIPLRAKGFTFGMSTNNTKTQQASQATTGNALTTTTNNKAAQASLQVGRALLDLPGLSAATLMLDGINVSASAALDYTASRNDQITSNRIGSSSNKHEGAGRSYGAGVAFSRLKSMNIRARTGRLRRNNDDTIEQVGQDSLVGRSVSETKSSGDTTSVDISVPARGKLQSLTVGFRTSNGIDTRPENATGISGSSQGTGFQFETTRTFSRGFNVTTKAKPSARFDMALTLAVSRDSIGYKIKRLSFTDTERRNWKIENHLQIWGTGLLTANYESSVTKVDRDAFNPLTSSLEKSPQTRRDDGRKLYTEFAKDLTKTLKTKLSYEIQLDQGFYKHPGASGGLSDVDQARSRLALDFSGQMTPAASAQVSMYYRTLDKAYIDASQSSLSKNEREYVVRPSYTWTIGPRVSVSQRFSLESKVLDDVFRPENSTLDRNHTMNTAMKYDLTSRLHLDTQYDYGLQDNGSYVTVYGLAGRYYTPLRRTKKDQITLNTRCDLLREGKLSFVSQQVSTRTRRLNSSGAVSGAPITESDALTLGVESKLELNGAKLDCRLRWTNNNFSGKQRSYVDGNASFEWSF